MSAEKSLTALLTGQSALGLLPFRLVRQESPSLSDGADALIRYALEEGAEGIALTSHGRSGAGRLLLGSFAESLILRSPLPVLIVSPKARQSGPLKKIIFPTDFSEASRSAFDRTIRLSAGTGASVILFHKLDRLYPEVGNLPPGEGEFRDAASLPAHLVEEQLLYLADSWIADARRAGVAVTLQVDLKPGRPLTSLLRLVEQQGEDAIVAMASISGPVRAFLLGSLARQIARHCPRPVLIFHAEQESLTRTFLNQATRVAMAFSVSPTMG
jgi:nucleotide-binding universal stress UspA family protein